MADSGPDFYTVQEVAARLRLTRRALESWRSQGKGPGSVLVGNRRLYPRREVEKFIAELNDRAAARAGV